MENLKKYVAEFIGTFVLVFAACGTAAAVGCTAEGNAAYVGTALAFGLVIVAMAYSIGNVSGCHINPAVSLAMFINKKLSAKDFGGYVIAQVLGATVAAGILKLFTGDAGVGANGLQPGVNVGQALFMEIILTCIFVLVILGVTSKPENGQIAGLVIGGALTLVHLIGIHFTGTSVNPARSFGPALIAGNLEGIWVFLLAPLVGGALAAVVYRFLDSDK